MWKERRPTTVDELCALLHGSEQESAVFAYRGQARSTWGLTPTILRDFSKYHPNVSERGMLQRECCVIELFQRKARMMLGSHERGFLRRIMECLMLMQHYGAPTRLLDWSRSPWIAAYFACIDEPRHNGAVWCVDLSQAEEANPPEGLQAYSMKNYHTGDFIRLYEVSPLALWYKISLEIPPDRVAMVRAPIEHTRINAQQGLFSIAGRIGTTHEKIGNGIAKPGATQKIVIRKTLKTPLLHRLLKMNIVAQTLFPDVSGVARRVKDSLCHEGLSSDEEAFHEWAELDFKNLVPRSQRGRNFEKQRSENLGSPK